MLAFLRQRKIRNLERQYLALLEQARDLQRNGDIKGFASKTAEAEAVVQRLEQLRQPPPANG